MKSLFSIIWRNSRIKYSGPRRLHVIRLLEIFQHLCLGSFLAYIHRISVNLSCPDLFKLGSNLSDNLLFQQREITKGHIGYISWVSFPWFKKNKNKKPMYKNHIKNQIQLVSKNTPTCNKMAVLCWLFIRLLMDSKSLLIDSSNSVCSLPSYNLLRDALGYPFSFHSPKCNRFNIKYIFQRLIQYYVHRYFPNGL